MRQGDHGKEGKDAAWVTIVPAVLAASTMVIGCFITFLVMNLDALSPKVGDMVVFRPDRRDQDVWQLKVMLHALGVYRPGPAPLAAQGDREANNFTADIIAAVDAFRTSEKMGTPAVGGSPAGLVDPELVAHLWAALDRAGKTTEVRQQLLATVQVRR